MRALVAARAFGRRHRVAITIVGSLATAAALALSQLPVGPSVAAAAASLLLTVTGTAGGLVFAAWAGLDELWVRRRTATRWRDVATGSGGDASGP